MKAKRIIIPRPRISLQYYSHSSQKNRFIQMEGKEKHTKSPLKIILRMERKGKVCLCVCIAFEDISIIYERFSSATIFAPLTQSLKLWLWVTFFESSFWPFLLFLAYLEYAVNNLRLSCTSQTVFIYNSLQILLSHVYIDGHVRPKKRWAFE